jgi:hypothetical protein
MDVRYLVDDASYNLMVPAAGAGVPHIPGGWDGRSLCQG